jgi:serine/threonine-protein kinase RsbW
MKFNTTEECVDNVELKIPCKPEYLRTVRFLVEELAGSGSLSPDAIEEVKVAASEAVANIIRHAYGPEGSTQPVFLKFCHKPGRLVIEVIDRGIGFTVPKDGQTPDLSREGGLGIILIRSLMDKVEYKSKPNMGTRIRMMKMAVPDRKSVV